MARGVASTQPTASKTAATSETGEARRGHADSPNKGFLKVLKERWAELGEATQEALQAAGFRPKPAPPIEDSSLCRLLSRKGDLPADIQLMLESEAKKPSATPYEEGQHSSNAKEQNQSRRDVVGHLG